MFEDPQDEMRQFIVEYLRQITTTGMPVEATIEDAGFWRIEAREEGAWALIQERPDGGGSEEKGRAADRETALTIAGIFNALSSDPEGISSDLAERAYADMAFAGPAQKSSGRASSAACCATPSPSRCTSKAPARTSPARPARSCASASMRPR